MAILDFFCFTSIYFTLGIANTEIGLYPLNSVIKRLWSSVIKANNSSHSVVACSPGLVLIYRKNSVCTY